ncbi:hypothetical protein D3C87_1922010 [compost metagenome]
MNFAPPAMAMAKAGIGALASTLMPSGTPTAREIRSVTTDMKAEVSGPMSSGLEKGTSPWFSTISPWMPPAISASASRMQAS